MKLLSFLKKQTADNCVILTYNANLPFFEYTVFEPIYANGCRNTLVICDPVQYNISLEDSSLLRYAGQRYLILPAHISPQSFHPKLIFLTDKESGHLLITSGNLTKAGYAFNWEVATHFEYKTRKPDLSAWQACHWAFDTVKRIVGTSDTTGLGSQRLDQLLGTTPWLRQQLDNSITEPVWPIHNLDLSILQKVVNQYKSMDGSPVREALVISPFFDRGSNAFNELLSFFSPAMIRLYTQDPLGLNPRSLKPILARHYVDFEAFQLDSDNRRLHAKALMLRTDRGVWLVTGSANFSKPALMQSASEGNTEIVTLRFEPDPHYFDVWMNELLDVASPLDIELIPEPDDEDNDKPAEEIFSIKLLSAVLDGNRLTLSMDVSPPLTSPLTVCLENAKDIEHITFENWRLNPGNKITVSLSEIMSIDINTPTLVSIAIVEDGVQVSHSSKVLMHNRQALDRFSRPIERKPRPEIPEDLVPESYEQCVEILDTLQELLATNKEQLVKHQKRIRQRDKIKEQEQQMAIEELGEYDPEEHFVEEVVRRPTGSAGEELYADYYDRLTYEDILRAALSAVYRSNSMADIALPITPDPRQSPKEDTIDNGKPDPIIEPDKDSRTIDEKINERIDLGFRRLVGNFCKGLQDEDYLSDAPARYLLELCLIILNYMRVVRKDEILADDTFLELSFDLYQSLWGWRGKPGVWGKISSRLSDLERAYIEEQMVFSDQIWFHTYVVTEMLSTKDDRRLYDFAKWMRDYTASAASPETLMNLPEYMYRNIWNASVSTSDLLPVKDMAERLINISQYYDHISLQTEIISQPEARVTISFDKNIANLSGVPAMEVSMPLSDSDLDYCFQIFIKFLNWPSPKQYAWLVFTNTNPWIETNDIRRVVVFYRYDHQTFNFAVERAIQGTYQPDIERSGITRDDLNKIKRIRDLENADASD